MSHLPMTPCTTSSSYSSLTLLIFWLPNSNLTEIYIKICISVTTGFLLVCLFGCWNSRKPYRGQIYVEKKPTFHSTRGSEVQDKSQLPAHAVPSSKKVSSYCCILWKERVLFHHRSEGRR